MEALIRSIVIPIVDHPNDIRVEEEEDGLRRPGVGGAQERESDPLGQFGLRVRTSPQEASKGKAPGRIVSIQILTVYL